MPPIVTLRTALISMTLAIPAAALLIETYLVNHPLPRTRTNTIRSSDTPSPLCLSSPSLQTVNPRDHIAIKDSYSIHLSKSEIANLSDEQILARFMKGYFGGWIFTPQRTILAILGLFGRKFVLVKFSGIKAKDQEIISGLELSSQALPPIHTVLFKGNFMLLDKNILPTSKTVNGTNPTGIKTSISFVEVGYGDNQSGFAGMHRFEVIRYSAEGDDEHGATIWYSSITCNPTVNKPVLPAFIFTFHKFYSKNLFRDGIAAVLRD